MAKTKDAWNAAFTGDLVYLKKHLPEKPKAIDRKSSDGYSLLHAAALGGQVAVIEFLLECGANVNAIDCFGCSVLQAAIMGSHAKPPQRLRLVTLLLTAGADPDHASESAGSILATVQNYRRSSKIRDLIVKYRKASLHSHKK